MYLYYAVSILQYIELYIDLTVVIIPWRLIHGNTVNSVNLV